MFLHVEQVTHLKDFTLRIEFSDGSVRDVDLSDELGGSVGRSSNPSVIQISFPRLR
jgi:hypothetical protein